MDSPPSQLRCSNQMWRAIPRRSQVAPAFPNFDRSALIVVWDEWREWIDRIRRAQSRACVGWRPLVANSQATARIWIEPPCPRLQAWRLLFLFRIRKHLEVECLSQWLVFQVARRSWVRVVIPWFDQCLELLSQRLWRYLFLRRDHQRQLLELFDCPKFHLHLPANPPLNSNLMWRYRLRLHLEFLNRSRLARCCATRPRLWIFLCARRLLWLIDWLVWQWLTRRW